MKLAKDEIARSGDTPPLKRFQQGIRAEATRSKYTAMLRRILCDILEDVLEGDFERRAGQFVRRGRDDPQWMTDLLLSLSWKLRERSDLPRGHADYLNPTSFKTYFKPIRKLLEMNDVTINWRRIYSTFPEKDNILDTRGWTRQEIAAMLVHARDPMDRAIILLLASSGVRLGGLNLTWGDLTPIYREGGRLTTDPDSDSAEVACVALSVYAGSPERYTAFASPEAYHAITQYGRVWAEMMLRQPKPKDPLFLATKMRPRRASEQVITTRVHRMAARAGLRNRNDKNGTRFETQLVHGFRKFFNKTCKETLSGDSLASLIRTEYMMGHVGLVSLDQSYFKTSMLEMAAEYVKAVPDLTIDDAERLRRSNRAMAENIQHMEDEKDGKIARLEAEMERMAGEREAEAARTRSEMGRMRREKDEAVERVRKEVAEIRDRSSATVDEMLNVLRKSSKADGVPGYILESFTTMLDRLGAAQESSMRDMKAEHNAAMADMKAEHDAEMKRVLRAVGGRAKDGDAGYDPLAEFRGDGA